MAKTLKFQSKLESISSVSEYYALSVPAKISKALGTKGPVPVSYRINGSKAFLVSLFPVGGGRHYLRVKAEARKAAKIKGGDRIRVEITVRDRAEEASIPKDLMTALRSERVLKDFESIPIGQRTFILRKIEAAAKPETRAKRIREAVEAAHQRSEKK